LAGFILVEKYRLVTGGAIEIKVKQRPMNIKKYLPKVDDSLSLPTIASKVPKKIHAIAMAALR
jgi:hypothetical protein